MLYYFISKYETQHSGEVACACVRACQLSRHVTESLQCSTVHIINVCICPSPIKYHLLFPSAFQMAAFQEIIPIKILYVLPTSSILTTHPSHPS
jgi:hypothetical protein